jgi:esterase/lipase superfamily enzyme
LLLNPSDRWAKEKAGALDAVGPVVRGIGLLSIVALGLASCASSEGFLVPVPSDADAPGTTHVEMVVATTRTRADSPAFLFGGGRSPEASFADMVVSIPPEASRKIGEVQWPQQPPGNPETDFVTLKSEIITREQATATFSRLLSHSHEKEALVFVHGFNNRFEDAVYRFAQILHDSGAGPDVAPVLFTWPSAGNVFAYEYDRDSANYSRDALEKLLRYLQDDPDIKTISILAHSMGNWVTVEALRQMAIRHGGISAKIKNIMLASPDVDVDVFGMQMAAMGPNHPRFTLFVSDDDKALAASRWFWGSTDRLGSINPDAEPYLSDLKKAKVDVVKLSKVKTGGGMNHGKFAESPEVVRLIGRQLSGGQPITDQEVTLKERLVAIPAAVIRPLE